MAISCELRFGPQSSPAIPRVPRDVSFSAFAYFRDDLTGGLVEASGVVARIWLPNGALDPSPPAPVRAGVGIWRLDYTPTFRDLYTVEISCTAPDSAADTRRVLVQASAPDAGTPPAAGPVESVNGRTGPVVLDADDLSHQQPGTGAVGLSLAAILHRRPFHVREYGAEGDGTNERAELQNALDAAAADRIGTVLFTERHRVTGDLIIPTNVELAGAWPMAGERSGTDYAAQHSALAMESGSVVYRWGAGLRDCLVLPFGWTKPANTVRSLMDHRDGFAGVGVSIRGSDALGAVQEPRMRNVAILGFDVGIDIFRSERARVSDVLIDCTNGVRMERVRDVARFYGVHVWGTTNNRYTAITTSYAVLSTANDGGLLRLNTATHPFVTGDRVNVVLTVGGTLRRRTTITVIDAATIRCDDLPWDAGYAALTGSVWPAVLYRDGVGFDVIDAERVTLTDCFDYGHEIGFRAGDTQSWLNIVAPSVDNYNAAGVLDNVAFEIAGTARGVCIMGGETNSVGTGVRINTPGALHHRLIGVELNVVTGGTVFDVIDGRAILTACETSGSGTANIGSGVDDLALSACRMPSITVTNAAAAGVVIVDSTCRFANVFGARGEITSLVIGGATAGGGALTALHVRGSPTADPARGGEIQITNPTAGQSFFLRVSSSANLLALNNSGVLVYSLTQAGAMTLTGGLVMAPGASLAPASNGQVTFDTPSNTQLRIRHRGSDGVTREATITLA